VFDRAAEYVDESLSAQTNYAADSAIQFALYVDNGMQFLQHWSDRDFDTIRREWPHAPEEVFIGVDPSL
jgi:hypothetical protein